MQWQRLSLTYIPHLVIKKHNQHTFRHLSLALRNLPSGNACSVSSHFPQASVSNLCLPRFLSFINRAVGGGGPCWIFAKLLHLSGSSLQKPSGSCPPIDPQWKLFILATSPTPLPDLLILLSCLYTFPLCAHKHTRTRFHNLPTTKYLIWQY